jgi:PKD repeat protein
MKIYLLIVISIFLVSSVSASFTKANVSIEEGYAPGAVLRGWLNISLQDESTNSLLTAFDSEISILEFLENNALTSSEYSCSPADCETGYITSNQETSKTFSLNFGGKKVIGLKIEGGVVSDISKFSMKITSDAGEASYPQLFTDILNNEELEWQAHSGSGNFRSEIYGCYESGSVTGQAEIITTEYCEKITIPFAPNVKIGADIIGNETVDFEMHVYDEDYNYDEVCTASASGSGKISCVADLTVTKEQDFFVCIATKNSADNSKYSINYEQDEPCGFSGTDSYNYDFPIFAQPGRYAPLGSFLLEDEVENMESYIEEYIDERYNSDCTDECVVPIRFISGKSQEITISNVDLTYTSGVTKTTHDIYDIAEEPAKINMGFQKLDLEEAGLLAPTGYGEQNLILELGGEEIISQKINIAKVTIIDFVVPLNVPAAMEVKFTILASGATNYKWDFGDGTEVETISNSTSHTYSSIGAYELEITAENVFGESVKSFSINVKSPEEEINRTLAEKREKLEDMEKQLEGITGWYKGEIKKQVNLEDIESELDSLERKYELASTSSEYVGIMSDLMELKVPDSLKVSKSSGAFLPDAEDIDPNYLIDLGIREDNPENYKNSIINWINENTDMNVESKSYYLDYIEEQLSLFTVISLKINPKQDFSDESYLIIDKGYDEIIFKENYREKAVGSATAITFSELEKDKEKIVGFILPEKVEIINLPLYLSPAFSQLEVGDEISPCDNDQICEKEQGETLENCPNDCTKVWKKIIIYLAILLFAAFVVYIVLQEWYKRYYEKHLFKNRNDLFNVISFISNALNQGINRKEIIKRLREYNWDGEQIIYAFKKVKGERTGMWEVPIFRSIEKRKLKKELEKRQKLVYPPKQTYRIQTKV